MHNKEMSTCHVGSVRNARQRRTRTCDLGTDTCSQMRFFARSQNCRRRIKAMLQEVTAQEETRVKPSRIFYQMFCATWIVAITLTTIQ